MTALALFIGSKTASGFSSSSSSSFDVAAIQIMITDMEYSEIAEDIGGFSFLNSAHACSPPEPEPTQAIESIQITSAVPVYPNQLVFGEGEDISNLFNPELSLAFR